MKPAASAARAPRETDSARAVPLEELLSYQICILAKLIERTSASELDKAYELGVAEWRVLAQLSVHSPSTVRWIAARMRVDRAEVSRAAAGLIARKLARREADPTDARSALFSVSESGRALYRAIMPLRMALHERLLSALTPDEARTLTQAVAKLIRFLDRDETVVTVPAKKTRARHGRTRTGTD
jgi:DNA-binding MarR family transcriptional regulator